MAMRAAARGVCPFLLPCDRGMASGRHGRASNRQPLGRHGHRYLRSASWNLMKPIPDDLCPALRSHGFFLGRHPFGFSYLDPTIPALGCKPDFSPQDCESDLETRQFEMREMDNTDWLEDDFEKHLPMIEQQCLARMIVSTLSPFLTVELAGRSLFPYLSPLLRSSSPFFFFLPVMEASGGGTLLWRCCWS